MSDRCCVMFLVVRGQAWELEGKATGRATRETRRVLFVVIIRVLLLFVFVLFVRVRFTQ